MVLPTQWLRSVWESFISIFQMDIYEIVTLIVLPVLVAYVQLYHVNTFVVQYLQFMWLWDMVVPHVFTANNWYMVKLMARAFLEALCTIVWNVLPTIAVGLLFMTTVLAPVDFDIAERWRR